MKNTVKLSYVDIVGLALVIIGALNWGLIGLGHFLTGGNWNLVNVVVGAFPTIEFAVYLFVGIAAVWTIYMVSQIEGFTRKEGASEPESKPHA